MQTRWISLWRLLALAAGLGLVGTGGAAAVAQPALFPATTATGQLPEPKAAEELPPSSRRKSFEPPPQVSGNKSPVGSSVRLPRLPPAETMPYTNPDAFLEPQSSMRHELPAPGPNLPGAEGEPVAVPPAQLVLNTVLQSIENDYPLLAAVFQERGITAGGLLAAEGPFNTRLVGEGKSVPLGYYQYTMANMYLERANWRGGSTFGGYRIGTGPNFPIYFGELESNTGGEFRAGFSQSLLQGLAIDRRRADFAKAQIARSVAEPVIQTQRIEFMRAGAVAYWQWLGAGRKYIIAQQVLNTALERDRILAERVRVGDAAPIERADNQRIVVDRQARLIGAGRAFQETAILLSLYYRDPDGLPLLPDPQQLPHLFPMLQAPAPELLTRDVQIAFQWRPELRELALKRQSLGVDLNLARNQMLPILNWHMLTAQDVGAETAPLLKAPFQLETGLTGSVPLERSAARGNSRTAQASIAQVTSRLRWAEDRITADVQQAVAAIVASHGQLAPRRRAVQLTYELEVAERRRYELGDSNLFILNLRELDTRDAASLEIDAIVNYFVATAHYHAALGLDGLRIRNIQASLK